MDLDSANMPRTAVRQGIYPQVRGLGQENGQQLGGLKQLREGSHKKRARGFTQKRWRVERSMVKGHHCDISSERKENPIRRRQFAENYLSVLVPSVSLLQ